MNKHKITELLEKIKNYLTILKIPSNGYWGGDVREAKEKALSILAEQGITPCLEYIIIYINNLQKKTNKSNTS